MRSTEDQSAGLDLVRRAVAAHQVNVALSHETGDVVALSAWHPDEGFGRSEIVYAADGYDLWKDGDLVGTDLSVEASAAVLVREYCEMKARVVARRWIKRYGSGSADALATVLKVHGA